MWHLLLCTNGTAIISFLFVLRYIPTYFSTYYLAFILLQKIIPFFAYIVVFLKALKRFFMLTLASVVW